MSPRPPADSASRPLEVAIVGNDAVLAALPFRTMQLAHALHACGFDFVVPVSWGEELVAREVLRQMAVRDASPAIFCACPLQRSRLLAAGSELAPFLISLASPTVATARYLRAQHPSVPLRITAVGGCPGEGDPVIDARIAALELHALLDAHGVLLAEQPEVFESVFPPDRRRYFSLPGGMPTPRMLEMRVPERRAVTITDLAFADELAEVLLGGESVLVDLSPRLACTCCGGFVSGAGMGGGGRDQILRREPPRALSPILELDVAVDLQPDAIRAKGADPAETGSSFVTSSGREEPRLPVGRTAPASSSPATTHAERAQVRDVHAAPDALVTHEKGGGERARIAVTPAGAVRGASTRRRNAPPSPPAPTAATTEGAAPRWTVPSEHPAHAPHAPRITTGLPLHSGGDLPLDTSTAVPAVVRDDLPSLGVADMESLRHGDVAVPLEPAREGMPVVQEESHGGETWSSPGSTGERVEVPFGDTQAPSTGGAHEAGADAPLPLRRLRTPAQRFLLARSQPIPRATTRGRRVPRAYARHLSAPVRATRSWMQNVEADELQLDDAGESATERVEFPDDALATRTDVELRLEVSLEPPITSLVFVSADPEDDESVDEDDEGDEGARGGEGGEGGEDATLIEEAESANNRGGSEGDEGSEGGESGEGALVVEPRESLENTEEVARAAASASSESAPPPRGAGEALAPPAGSDGDVADRAAPLEQTDSASASGAVTGAIHEEVLARVRERARATGRVVSREIPPPRPPREPGSLAVFIASAILIVALLVSLAVIFRRAPTAPW